MSNRCIVGMFLILFMNAKSAKDSRLQKIIITFVKPNDAIPSTIPVKEL